MRGVCVLGMLSRTFAAALGSHAQHTYLQNARMDAATAYAAGLVDQVCVGVHATQTHTLKVGCILDGRDLVKALCWSRAAVDLDVLAREAVGHVECQVRLLINV